MSHCLCAWSSTTTTPWTPSTSIPHGTCRTVVAIALASHPFDPVDGSQLYWLPGEPCSPASTSVSVVAGALLVWLMFTITFKSLFHRRSHADSSRALYALIWQAPVLWAPAIAAVSGQGVAYGNISLTSPCGSSPLPLHVSTASAG
jgi:hypothetical protein